MSTSFEIEPGRMNGWKEIAVHLGKGTRTVQRWEKLYGLPVHRIGREGGEIVYAFRDEIDRWMESTDRDRVANGEEPPSALEAELFEPPAAEGVHDGAPPPRRRWAIAVLLLWVLAAGLGALSPRGRPTGRSTAGGYDRPNPTRSRERLTQMAQHGR